MSPGRTRDLAIGVAPAHAWRLAVLAIVDDAVAAARLGGRRGACMRDDSLWQMSATNPNGRSYDSRRDATG